MLVIVIFALTAHCRVTPIIFWFFMHRLHNVVVFAEYKCPIFKILALKGQYRIDISYSQVLASGRTCLLQERFSVVELGFIVWYLQRWWFGILLSLYIVIGDHTCLDSVIDTYQCQRVFTFTWFWGFRYDMILWLGGHRLLKSRRLLLKYSRRCELADDG